jgi:hypothetical protein
MNENGEVLEPCRSLAKGIWSHQVFDLIGCEQNNSDLIGHKEENIPSSLTRERK